MSRRPLSNAQRDVIAARGRRCERAMRDAAEARAQGRVAKAAVRRLAARLESLMAFVEATA